jgi:hypothetical protein
LLDEIVFFHRISRTVIFTDLIMDFDSATFSPLSRVTTQWNQMYQHTPRGVQFTHIFDRASLRDSLKTVRHWQPERVIVAHSPWLCVEGDEQVTDFLDSAFNWLTPQPALVENIMALVRLLTLLLIVAPIHALIVLTADIILPGLMKRDEKLIIAMTFDIEVD